MTSFNEVGLLAQKRFGDVLKTWRLQRGLTQESLAHRAGLHPSYVAQVERGQRNISLRNIHILAEALEIRPANLLAD